MGIGWRAKCRWSTLAFTCVATWLLGSADATTFVLQEVDELALRSDVVVIGTVSAVDVERTIDHGVLSKVTIAVSFDLLGSAAGDEIVLVERGGRVGDFEERLFGAAEYRIGERVLVFARRNRAGQLATVDMAMGKLRVVRTADDGAVFVRQFGEGVSVYDPLTWDAGDVPLVLSATDALESLRSSHLVPLPELIAGLPVADPDQVASAFEYSSSLPSRWYEPDSGQTVRFKIDPAGDNGVGAADSLDAVQEAFDSWSAVGASSLLLASGGPLTTLQTFSGCSGENRIVFNDPFNEITDPSGCGGVLAVGGYCSAYAPRTVNGVNYRRITLGRVTFNNGFAGCPYWDKCSLSEVATHEVGHALGFGHSPVTDSVMRSHAYFNGRCTRLGDDDVDAVSFVYPADGEAYPTPTPAPPTPTLTPTHTPAPPTWTPTQTRTRTRTRTRTPSYTPTRSYTPTATLAPGEAPAATATSTYTPTHTPTRTATRTSTRTRTNTPSPSATRTYTSTVTRTRTNTPSSTATRTYTVTRTRTNTPSPSATRTDTSTVTRTRTNTPSSTATRTHTVTRTRTNTPSPSATRTYTNTATTTRSNTPSPTATWTFTASRTRTRTPSRTATRTYTNTPSPSATRTHTSTVTRTRTNTPSPTATRTFTATRTRTDTPSRTVTRTYTNTATRTRTSTPSPTATRTFTATRTRTDTPNRTATPVYTNTATRTRTKTPSPSPTQTNTSTATRPRTNTPSATATRTYTNTATRTRTHTPSPTVTRTRTRTNPPSATATSTYSRTATPTRTNTPSPTATRTYSNTATRTRTSTRTPTASRTQTGTNTPNPSATNTESPSRTATRTRTSTPSPTAARTFTASPTASRSQTATRSVTPSQTATPTRTSETADTPVPSFTATVSPTFTATVTAVATAPPTASASPTATAVLTPTPQTSMMSIQGQVLYSGNGGAVANSTIYRDGNESLMGVTDLAGRFSVEIEELESGSVSFRTSKVGDFRGGVSSLDAVHILQHAAGGRELSALQRSACDVTGDGLVTELDASRVMELVLGGIDRFPAGLACGSDWAFSAGGSEPMVGACGGRGIQASSDLGDIQIDALALGDCTSNWGSASFPRSQPRRRGLPRARITSLRMRGRRALLPIYIRSSRPYHSIDVGIVFDGDLLEPTGARLLGGQRDSIIEMRDTHDGGVRLAVANLNPLNRGRRQILLVEFRVVGEGGTPEKKSIAEVDLQIDEMVPRLSTANRR